MHKVAAELFQTLHRLLAPHFDQMSVHQLTHARLGQRMELMQRANFQRVRTQRRGQCHFLELHHVFHVRVLPNFGHALSTIGFDFFHFLCAKLFYVGALVDIRCFGVGHSWGGWARSGVARMSQRRAAPLECLKSIRKPIPMTAPTLPTLTTLTVQQDGPVAEVKLNRPDKANAMNVAMWQEIRTAFDWIDQTESIRVAILSGQGAHFCSGIDLSMLANVADSVDDDCEGRKREKLRRFVLDLQDTLTSLERCRKPVIAAIHGACIGGGIDLICCADLRYSSADAHFSVKEIDMGMTADVGTLQRLPKLIAPGVAREWAFTGAKISADEAARVGFVNRVFSSAEDLHKNVADIAKSLAAKSPMAMRGTKEMLNYTRDHSVADGLNYIATWNAAMLMSSDLQEAMMTSMQKKPPKFRD